MGNHAEIPKPIISPPLPGNRIMWLLGEKEENNPRLIEDEARDISDKGFLGVLIIPRAGKLDLRHPRMIDLFERAAVAAKSNGMDPWLLADPRLGSEGFIEETAESLEVLIINRTPTDFWNGSNLNTTVIENGKFTWEMEYPELRLTHMLQSGGVTYDPVGLEKVYVFNRSGSGTIGEIRDITKFVDWQHDKLNHKIVIDCEVADILNGWEVIAFPRFKTNFFDYTGAKSWEAWIKYIDLLFERIDCISGICLDEPGFYCEFGKFPWGDSILDHFRKSYDYNLEDRLAWLVLNSADNSHVHVRNCYYQLLNNIITASVSLNWSIASRSALRHNRAPGIQSGIHATWHGEFCGIEDMVHGSLDIWNIRPHQSAAFSDVGGGEKLIRPEAAPDIIYSLVLARSLSRVGPNKGIIYFNFWGIEYGYPDDDAPPEVVDYWRDLLDLFSARWIAHGYGNPNTRTHKLNFGPGYPDHPTWSRFKALNSPDRVAAGSFEVGEPVSDVLFVYPLEGFYAIGHMGGNRLGELLVSLVDLLTRKGYMVDIVSSEWMTRAEITDGAILLNGCSFGSLVVPYGNIMPESLKNFTARASDAGIPVIEGLFSDDDIAASDLLLPDFELVDRGKIEKMFGMISDSVPPTFDLPEGSIGNVRKTADGYLVHLIPDRAFGKFSGTFRYSGLEVEIDERTEPLIVTLELDD